MAWQGNGMDAAWARHAMCESALKGLTQCSEWEMALIVSDLHYFHVLL